MKLKNIYNNIHALKQMKKREYIQNALIYQKNI